MISLDVDGLTFEFPDGWQVTKYDEWKFYRTQWAKMSNNIKALDVLAVDPDKTVWLIEVKDYRANSRTKPSELGQEVADKVFCTLAALLPAKVNSKELSERKFAAAVCKVKKFRIVLHLERNRSSPLNPANIKLKLKQLLKPVDAHPIVAEMGRMGNLAWTVRDTSLS